MLALAVLQREAVRSTEWNRRGIRIEPYEAQPLDEIFARKPSIIVLDVWHAAPEQTIACWQIHDLFGIPVLAVAQSANAKDIVALFRRGAADVVSDSASVTLLAARARAILRRLGTGTAVPPPSLRWSGTVVDLARQTIRRDDAEFPLSRNEFTVLMMLWRAGGRTCTKSELGAALRGARNVDAERNLRTYIHHLRRKLEDHPERPRRLVNAWGRGYRLILEDSEPAAAAHLVVRLPDPANPEPSGITPLASYQPVT
jgi:two-component system, OmpR family, KDP operon response regulator KdpE